MKIDIHTHTRKCKSGDAPTREISSEGFCDAIQATDVRIVAITNHNVFDLPQYKDITQRISKDRQVWPGIEIDVVDDGSRAHLIVIVSPTRADEFSRAVNELTHGSSPETFTASIEQVLARFEPLRPLYVAHYKQKKPDLSDAALAKLMAGVQEPACVLKEVTNSISAGISISHGHASIYGSDVHDWAVYEKNSHQLPDLRLPVDSFDHFCLLLKKDRATINTALDKKTPEELTLVPFEDGSIVKLRIYNDINVIFGPKGTGKSCILKEIAQRYAENGTEVNVYEHANDRLDEIFDIKGQELQFDPTTHGVGHCSDEIESLRAAAEVGVTVPSKYAAHFSANSTSRNAKKILLKEIDLEDESPVEVKFEGFNDAVQKTREYLSYLLKSEVIKTELTAEEYQKLTTDVAELSRRLQLRQWSTFSEWQQVRLLNSAIEVFRTEVGRKSDARAKPTHTGFANYAKNRIRIEVSAAELLKCVGTSIPMQCEPVGSLGSGKGDLEFRTEFYFQTGDVTDASLASLSGTRKAAQKRFIQCVRKVRGHAYADDLFTCIAELNSIDDVQDIAGVADLLMFKRYFALNGAQYTPSSGEASMLMLQKELETDKEVYILDEPERSLGNEYISEVIVPLIRERARAGRKVFISTHDANIAVRTLPYCSVYRCHGPKGYKTYTGNPFSNSLVNTEDETDTLDWKKISMRTLEGGEEAFGERSQIYGNDKG